jgi:5-methylcytosine-specific restriction endonuclease McrA
MTTQTTIQQSIIKSISKTYGKSIDEFAKLSISAMADHIVANKDSIPCVAPKKQGPNWIQEHKRNAIYLRDGARCSYCGALYTAPDMSKVDVKNPSTWSNVSSTIDRRISTANCDGSIVLTLDHIIPRIACLTLSEAGLISSKFMNSEANLTTCCKDCNDRRNDQNVADFIKTMATFNRYTSWNKSKAAQRIAEIVTGERHLKNDDIRVIHDALKSFKKADKDVKCKLPSKSQRNGIGYPKVMTRVTMASMISPKSR